MISIEIIICHVRAVGNKLVLAQINEKDNGDTMNIIDTMLTKQKFQNFHEQNLQTDK